MAAGLKDRGVDLRDAEIVIAAAAVPRESLQWRWANPKRLPGGKGGTRSATKRRSPGQWLATAPLERSVQPAQELTASSSRRAGAR